MKYSVAVVLIIYMFTSCQSVPSRLEQVLTLSGENRNELEKVIDHYSQNRADSLKLKAAIYLIENMPGHYSYYGESLDNYLDSVHHSPALKSYPWHLRNMFLIQPYRKASVWNRHDVQKIDDIHHITADYLIHNIEKSFLAWEKPWATHFGFDDFCEYLLPYRVENEPLMNWRDSLEHTYADALKHIENVDELFESPYQACSRINTLLMEVFREMKNDSVIFKHPLTGDIEVIGMGCPEFVYAAVFVMRSLGIPISIDRIEQWSTRRGKHYWNAVYHFTGLHYPFTGYDSRPRGLNQDYKLNKVYRNTYAPGSGTLVAQQPREPIPPFFRDPFLKDVTREYMTCHDITIGLDFPPEEKREYAYLCVFNNEHWIPVHWGKIRNNKVIFTDIGPQTVYIAGYYIDEEIVPASAPFHVTLAGEIKFIKHSEELQSITIRRKYPLYSRFAGYSRNLIGATIETATTSDFQNAKIRGMITHDANTLWDSIYLAGQTIPTRYIRINHTKKMELAELEFYDSFSLKIPVKRIILPDEAISDKKEHLLFNGSIGDFTEISHWIGFEFNAPVKIEKIRFRPRTDDNHISQGDNYELYLYNDHHLKPLQQKKAENYSLVFDSVPVGGLYLIKDITKGQEHRVFTYENGKMFFW